MKKLLIALCAVSSIAFADVQVDTKLMQNGRMLMQDSVTINDSFMCRSENSNCEEAIQCWTSHYDGGYVLCRLMDFDVETITFNIEVVSTVGNQEEIISKPTIKTTWDNEAVLEFTNAEGECLSISLVARRI